MRFTNESYKDKHLKNNIGQYALILALMAVFALPARAQAFELGLALAPVSALALSQSAVLISTAEAPQDLSSYLSHSVIASASPITKAGERAAVAVRRYASSPAVHVTETVQSGAVAVLEGEASYYSRAGCLGCHPAMIMANGQPLNDNALTMAIGADKKHLVGRTATVTSLATGKSVRVTITDTGGFYQAKYGHRVADLTIATKTAIGMAGGVGQVRVEIH